MIEITCQVKELMKKLTVLSKVKMGSTKSLAPISVRVNDKTNLCELCLCFNSNYNQHSTYTDYYANVDIITSQGNGMFVLPSFIELLEILKTIEPDVYIVTQFENNKVTVLYGEDVIFDGNSEVPDDSHIQLLNTFEFETGFTLPSALLDYTSNLLKVIPSKKDLTDKRCNSVVFDKHPLQSNSLVLMRTDSIRLMCYPISLDTEWPFGCVVVPQGVMAWVSKLKKKKNKNVLIKIHDHGLSLEYDDYRVVCLVDKTFPPVNDFIKADIDCVLTVSTKPFLKAVEYAAIGDVDNAVIIKAKNKEVKVYSYGDESRKRRVNCELNSDKEFELTIKSQFLTSILKMCGNNVSISSLLSLKDIYKITSPDNDFHYIVGCFKKSY
jgi:DNA polymerase III sliding clamp (beta) subunit (PCNA family)